MWPYNNRNRNGRENSIEIPQLITTKFAIRGALGNLGMGHLLQNLEEDLLRWAGEAYEKITANTRAGTIYVPVSETQYVENNRVKLCTGFKALQCLKLNGCVIPFLYNKHRCTTSCNNSCGTACNCCGNGGGNCAINSQLCTAFYLDQCWVKFAPEAANGLKVEIEAWATPYDDEGYPLVIDKTTTAIQQYISWMVCLRQGDNRAAAFQQMWYFDCRQARSWINKKTDAELLQISKYWQPANFFIPNTGYCVR